MAYLDILDGPHSGTSVRIPGSLTMGRNPANLFCLNDTSASRRHAEITHKGSYYALVDFGSANGTIVNNTPLHKLVPRPLYDGDEIVIGSNRMIFHAQGEQPPGPHGAEHQENSGLDITQTKKCATSLSVIMTQDDKSHPSFNATIDASLTIFDTLAGKQATPAMLLDAIRRLQSMVKVSNDLGALTRPESLVEQIMDSIFDIFPNADRAFVMLRDKKTNDFRTVAARKRAAHTGSLEQFAVSRTVIKTVVEQKQSILSSDALSDSRFARQQSVVDLSIRSMMCAPFICKEEILGVIGVDTTAGRSAFNSDDLAMLTGIAAQAAIAIKNSDLFIAIEQETQVKTQLARYLSPDVVEGVVDGTIPLHLGGEKKRGTILFSDIVGFTSMAEHLSATEVVDKLNCYFSVTTGIITRNRGTLHKFGGDMIMAFWNVMFPDLLAEENAIRTGLEMQNAVWLFDLGLESQGQRPIHLGIGCNTGEFAGGNIGGTERMEYTVIGDNVNLAQRIESLACRWQVLVSSETWEPVKSKCIAVGLPPLTVKGRAQPIKVYSIRGIAMPDDSLLLNIPIHILTPDGAVAGSGLLTGCRGNYGNRELHLSTIATIPAWDTLTIQYDLHELARSPRLIGSVEAAGKTIHSSKASYMRIALNKLDGDDAAMQLLEAGSLLESLRSWPDMKRH